MASEEILNQKRLATSSEKQLLFDALKKEGKKWNPITLEVEDLKVEPKIGDCVKAKYITGKSYLGRVDALADGWRLDSNKELGRGRFQNYETIKILTRTQFQSEVNALGFEYDFDTDKFNELKWKPSFGGDYFSISAKFEVVKYEWTSSEFDLIRYRMNIVFSKPNIAKECLEKIKKLLK